MSLIAVPNVSEGRDQTVIDSLVESVLESETRVLDVHADRVHNRTVITATGRNERLVDAMANLAQRAATLIDLRLHEGQHPRLGVLDVCPIVPHGTSMREAVGTAHRVGRAILKRAGIPVYFYGDAALRLEAPDLPDIRRTLRNAGDLTPDLEAREVDPRTGVACVGARSTLIAFNVSLACDVATARSLAGRMRSESVRALGFAINESQSQVSMNLIDPGLVGIEEAFEGVERAAQEFDVTIVATEIVGLAPQRFMPHPEHKSARLLLKPGRSLETALTSTN